MLLVSWVWAGMVGPPFNSNGSNAFLFQDMSTSQSKLSRNPAPLVTQTQNQRSTQHEPTILEDQHIRERENKLVKEHLR